MKIKLKNGLTVIYERWEGAPAAALNLWVKAGSRNERKEEAGISHLIEHMIFKGTERRGVGELAREVESSGGEVNAFTSLDSTVYYITLPVPFSEWGLDLLAEAIERPAMDAGELDLEREVVVAEIRGGMDQPSRRLQNELLATCYRQHPYGRPVIGYERTLHRLGRGDLQSYLRRWYRPSNMVLAVVGDLEEKKALSLIKGAFASISGGIPPRLKLRPEPPQRAFRWKLVEGKFHVAHLDLAFRIPHLFHPDIAALDVLGALLGQGESSLLYREVKEERGLVDTISAYAYTPLDPGLLIVGSTFEPEILSRALEATLEVIFRLRRERAGEADLERAKVQVESDLIYQKETVQGRARALAYFEAMMGGPEKEDHYLTAIRRVSSEDITRVARCYLEPRHLSVACLLPQGRAPEARELRSAVGQVWRGCMTIKTPSRRDTSVRRHLFPNGLTLLVKERAESPTVTMRAAFLGGQRFERKETSGISNFVAEMLDRGTLRLKAGELSHRMESIGGGLEGFSGRNSFGLAGEFLSRRLEEGLDLFTEVLLEPAFDEKEVAKARRDIMAELRRQKDNLPRSAFRLFARALYGPHPYGMELLGTTSTVRALSREDLLGYWRSYALSRNMVLSVVGDVDAGRVKDLFEGRLGSVASKAFRPPRPNLPPRPSGQLLRQKLRDKEQAHLILGFLGTTLSHPDRYPLAVMTEVLSAQSGRLFLELREKRGLAYAVSAFSHEGIEPGSLGVYAGINPERVGEVLAVVREELERLREELLPVEELERARRHLIGTFKIGIQRNAALAADLAFNELYGLGCREYLRYPGRIEAVTREEVRRVARRYLKPENSALAVVGPGDKGWVSRAP